VHLAPDGSSDHYLQVGIVYEVENDKVTDALKLQLPVIRGKILLLLSSKTSADLSTVAGKDKLAEELLEAARAPLPTEEAKKGVAGVHYASFVIQ
jgi:flagellar FliL protein